MVDIKLEILEQGKHSKFWEWVVDRMKREMDKCVQEMAGKEVKSHAEYAQLGARYNALVDVERMLELEISRRRTKNT